MPTTSTSAPTSAPAALTDSGYPRSIKHWRRGQPLAEAATVFEAEAQDIAAFVSVDPTPGFERTVFGRALDMYRSAHVAAAADGRALPIDKPDDASLDFWRDAGADSSAQRLGTVGGRTWPRGALLVADADAYLRGERELQALFTPSADTFAGRLHAPRAPRAAQRARQRVEPARGMAARPMAAGSGAKWPRRFPARWRWRRWHDPLARRRPAGRSTTR